MKRKFDLIDEKYRNWDGRNPKEIFKNLGIEKAKELYDAYRESGMNIDDAWIEVYAKEING